MDLSWLTASPWPLIAAAAGVTAVLIAAAWLMERRAQERYEALSATGEPAEATVLSTRDTGWRTNGRRHIGFELEVRRAGAPPYRAEARLMLPYRSRSIPYPPGSVVQVRVDRDRPERVAIPGATPALGGGVAEGAPALTATGAAVGRAATTIIVDGHQYTSLDELPPQARAAYAQAVEALADRDGDGLPDIFGGPAVGPASAPERLRQLKAMLDEGLVTPEEYAAKRAQILEQL